MRLLSVCTLFAAAAAASLPAQQNPSVPGTQPGQGGTQPPQGIPGREPWQPEVWQPGMPRSVFPNAAAPLQSTWVRPEDFQGFPVFPPNLGGYGGYPAPPPGFLQPPDATGPLPPPLVPAPPDWPAWIQRKRGEDLPYEAGTAVLVRLGDRVWVRAAGDDAFVPLYHYDTVRGLHAGADIQVRHVGQFQLLLYGASRVVSIGPAELQIVELGERSVRLRLPSLTRIALIANARGMACTLPDGSEVIIDPSDDGPDAATRGAGARLHIERSSEPVQYRGRATIVNTGDRPARWRTPFGERVLEPGRRVTLFLDPPPLPLPSTLSTDRVGEGQADGARRRWQGTGAVTWSGARFQLGDGSSLELDPLLGDPFAPPEAPRSPPAAEPTPPRRQP